jgi:hypothetical protein
MKKYMEKIVHNCCINNFDGAKYLVDTKQY